MIFKLMPIIVAFMFSAAAVGLVIYWTWSNTLSILQQYVIMRRNGTETELDKCWAKLRGKSAGTARPDRVGFDLEAAEIILSPAGDVRAGRDQP
ncbi:MAG: hypothetical protein WDN76_06920 [Alphaproteobacteria bacterium]